MSPYIYIFTSIYKYLYMCVVTVVDEDAFSLTDYLVHATRDRGIEYAYRLFFPRFRV